MKSNLFLSALLTLTFGVLSGQTRDEDGHYVSTDGTLYSGIITSVQNEVKIELSVKEGLADGPVFYYYPSGKLMESGQFSKGQKNEKWMRYSEIGALSAIAYYDNGKKNGTWLIYDRQGNKRFEMHYTNGEKTGTWTSWNDSGQVASTRDYGKLN